MCRLIYRENTLLSVWVYERVDSPIALLKFSISTSVFLISDEYTSLPTMGQNGTLFPSSCAMANAKAVCLAQIIV